jgi:hypothetical protein
MAKVLLDACVPQWLRNELGDAEVTTARYAGLDELSHSAFGCASALSDCTRWL